MKTVCRIIPWLILLISFAILAYFYNSLSNEILITRSLFGNESVVAPKSLFTVFRLPLIEMVCAAAVEIMRRKFAEVNAKISLMWNILLYTVSLKSLFQSLELVSTQQFADAFFYLTVGIVIFGILAAVFVARDCFSKSSRSVWIVSRRHKAILLFLLFVYLGLATVPILVLK